MLLSLAACAGAEHDAPAPVACHSWTAAENAAAAAEVAALPDNSILLAHDRDYIRVCTALGN